MSEFIYLASQSPRRRDLLGQLGVSHQLLLPNAEGDIAENAEAIEAVIGRESPVTYVQRVTRAKLAAAGQRLTRRGLPLAPVLCADTTVALGGRIYGKPADAADARRILTELAGTTHRVLTAVAVEFGGNQICKLSASRVRFDVSPAQIDAYIETQEPMGKAGAYAVQGRAAAWISHISGSYSGIMGLPMFETAQLLRAVGIKV